MRFAKAQIAKPLKSKSQRANYDSVVLSVPRGSKVGAGNIGESQSLNHCDVFLNRRFRGCLTPAQIDNLVKSMGGIEAFEEDPNVLDGYDEVDEEAQEKIRTALQQGHVPDEDWKGVSLFRLPFAMSDSCI